MPGEVGRTDQSVLFRVADIRIWATPNRVSAPSAAGPPAAPPTAALRTPAPQQPQQQAGPWCGGAATPLQDTLPTLERLAPPLERLPGVLDDLDWLGGQAFPDLELLPPLAFAADM